MPKEKLRSLGQAWRQLPEGGDLTVCWLERGNGLLGSKPNYKLCSPMYWMQRCVPGKKKLTLGLNLQAVRVSGPW